MKKAIQKTNKLKRKNLPNQKEAYRCWNYLFNRVHGNRKGYENVTICDEWYEFENFYYWWLVNYVEGYKLDKDITIPGNLEYSPMAVKYVPDVVNSFFRSSTSKHGVKGVYQDKRNGKYYAQIRIDGRTHQSGSSHDKYEAGKMYQELRKMRIKQFIASYPELESILTQYL